MTVDVVYNLATIAFEKTMLFTSSNRTMHAFINFKCDDLIYAATAASASASASAFASASSLAR